MANQDPYQAPFDVDQPDAEKAPELRDPDLDAAEQAWIEAEWDAIDQQVADASASTVEHARLDDLQTTSAAESGDEAASAAEDPISSPFVGRWHKLVSQTNWEKGRIIYQWRLTLMQSGAAPTTYSDEAWANQVGGVTAPHVGRLRRVFAQFSETYETYPALSWTHFLAAMDWDDAPLWLQGANDSGWSVSGMRRQRWEANGGDPANDPDAVALASVDVDEDFADSAAKSSSADRPMTIPAQGGGSTKKYEDEPSNVSSGPMIEGPDFGDEDSLNALPTSMVVDPNAEAGSEAPAPLVQPFAGLAELPNDLADAVELLKLAIVRHKATGWRDVEVDVVRSYLSAFMVLVDARSK